MTDEIGILKVTTAPGFVAARVLIGSLAEPFAHIGEIIPFSAETALGIDDLYVAGNVDQVTAAEIQHAEIGGSLGGVTIYRKSQLFEPPLLDFMRVDGNVTGTIQVAGGGELRTLEVGGSIGTTSTVQIMVDGAIGTITAAAINADI